MFKYLDYIKESKDNDVYQEGDEVIFTSKRTYYKNISGKVCKINYSYGDDEYSLTSPDGFIFSASSGELKKVENKSDETSTADIIENQFPNKINKTTITKTPEGKLVIGNQSLLFPTQTDVDFKKEKEEKFKKGQRVSVTGQVGRINFSNRKGTIINVGEDIQVEFDDDDSRNISKLTMMIDRSMVTSLNEPDVVIIKVGDQIECIDNTSKLFNQKGSITRTWPDGDVMCLFPSQNTSILMKPYQIKVIDSVKSTNDFKSTQTTNSDTQVTITKKIEEEEDDDDVSLIKKSTFKKEDLLEFSFEDFFDKEKTITKEEMLTNKKKYQDAVDANVGSELKLIFMEKALRTAEIVEQYFDFLIAKIAKDLPVYRTVEVIENEDLLTTKTKVRASESKEMTKKYSFDQGIIAYWKFKDAIVFKTI